MMIIIITKSRKSILWSQTEMYFMLKRKTTPMLSVYPLLWFLFEKKNESVNQILVTASYIIFANDGNYSFPIPLYFPF